MGCGKNCEFGVHSVERVSLLSNPQVHWLVGCGYIHLAFQL